MSDLSILRQAADSEPRRASFVILRAKQPLRCPQPLPLLQPSTPSQTQRRRNVVALISFLLASTSIFGVVVVNSSTSTSIKKLEHQVRVFEEQSHASVRKLRQTDVSQAEQISLLQTRLSELKAPPTSFSDAQDSFRAGRYAEAEAAFGRFLLESPVSGLRDIAIWNSALTNAMLKNCSMVRGRFNLFQREFPERVNRPQWDRLFKACLS